MRLEMLYEESLYSVLTDGCTVAGGSWDFPRMYFGG